ncbi:glucosyltransferase domain-containing protein [Butyrivibrio sp. MC2013]|uniref:glucosyltransferase domain-containing protein n=1 Tax=Butyrivibrio sp. MC2013 TaxID=1280686 RepID=UPI00040C537B|nr:glucosyltransferase domain-containing protein [Butyrivibrio sp. MC2013]
MKTKEYDLLPMIFKRIPRNAWIAFLAGIISGIVTHLYMLTNKYPNWDDCAAFNSGGTSTTMGRWLVTPVHNFFAEYSAPYVHGMFCIILLAVSAALVVNILSIRSATASAFTGILMVVFPSVASFMTYMFMAANTGVALLLVVLAVYFSRKYRFGWLMGAVLIFFAMGIYQAFFAFAASLMLMSMIVDSLFGIGSFSDLSGTETSKFQAHKEKHTSPAGRYIIIGVRHLLALGLGVLSYLILVKLSGWELEDYRGSDKMGELPLSQIPIVVARAYHRILQYFVTRPLPFMSSLYHIANIAVILLLIVVYLICVRKCKGHMLLNILSVAILPLALGLFYVMAYTVEDASTVMTYSYVLVYVMLLALIEQLSSVAGDKMTRILAAAVAIVMTVVSLCSYKIDNESYFRMHIAYERVYAYYDRLVVRLEEAGYTLGERVVVAGSIPEDLKGIDFDGMDYYRMVSVDGVTDEKGLMTEGVRTNFLRIYLGVTSGGNTVTKDETEAIKASESFKALDIYPGANCVGKIDDIWVIKVGD